MLPWIYPVRAIQIVFAIIVLGLTAYGLLPLLQAEASRFCR